MKIVNVVLFVIMNLLPKITYDHTKLISYPIMNVKLAAQVLSSTVSNVLSNYAPPDAAKYTKFCLLMVVLFDAVNIRDVTSHKFNLKSSKNASNEMFISQQTYEGLTISVNSITVQFLLQHEFRWMLTETFPQDRLENYFATQCSISGRKDNPEARYFGYNDNSIRNQKFFRSIGGNIRGVDKANTEFPNEPIPCPRK